MIKPQLQKSAWKLEIVLLSKKQHLDDSKIFQLKEETSTELKNLLSMMEKDMARTTEILRGLELDNRSLRDLIVPETKILEGKKYESILDGTLNNGLFQSLEPRQLITFEGKEWGEYVTLRLLSYHFVGKRKQVVFNKESFTKITTEKGKDILLTRGPTRIVTIDGYSFYEQALLMPTGK